MSNFIDPTAIINPDVTIGDGANVESFEILGTHDRFHSEAPTIIGRDSFISSRCMVYDSVTIGDKFDVSD